MVSLNRVCRRSATIRDHSEDRISEADLGISGTIWRRFCIRGQLILYDRRRGPRHPGTARGHSTTTDAARAWLNRQGTAVVAGCLLLRTPPARDRPSGTACLIPQGRLSALGGSLVSPESTSA